MKRIKCQETCREELFYYVTSGSNVTRDVHWCVTVDYQQIENDSIANQFHGFTIDNGKFILIPVISLHISKVVFKFTRSNRNRALELLAGTYSCLHELINLLNKIMFWSLIHFLAFLRNELPSDIPKPSSKYRTNAKTWPFCTRPRYQPLHTKRLIDYERLN